MATVRFVRDVGDSGGGSGISLRWWSRDMPNGQSERKICSGRVFLVPVALRREDQSDGRAFITGENWMLDKPDKEKWPLDPGRHYYWVEIWSRDRHWRSKHKYQITVPPGGQGNGHFTMQVDYGGIY